MCFYPSFKSLKLISVYFSSSVFLHNNNVLVKRNRHYIRLYWWRHETKWRAVIIHLDSTNCDGVFGMKILPESRHRPHIFLFVAKSSLIFHISSPSLEILYPIYFYVRRAKIHNILQFIMTQCDTTTKGGWLSVRILYAFTYNSILWLVWFTYLTSFCSYSWHKQERF